MRRFPLVLALILILFTTGSPASAQLETTPIASPQPTSPDLTGVEPLPLTGERRAEFEAYIADVLHRLGVPGASVAVVQDGQVVYLQGFGVREMGGTEPVTPDTQMIIGSVTKSMTSTMAATLVDDGLLAWDTPVVEVLPTFAVADPSLTPRLTIADTFCACTGIPRRDPEYVFNADGLTPERLIAQIAALPLTTPFGETFQYSNQLYDGYVMAMQDRLFNPMGMDRSTFSLDEVLAGGNYALPHNAGLDGHQVQVPLAFDQRFVTTIAPSGALWSTASDMARYLQMEFADGVAPDGTRVVSEENLARTREPRVAIPPPPGQPPVLAEATQHYAMGWFLGTWRGLTLVNHSGGTFGFGSKAAFLPDADVGLVVLTNDAQSSEPFSLAVQHRLFELLFDQPAEFEAGLTQFLEQQAQQVAEIQAALGEVDPEAVAPFLGRYTNPGMGEVDLVLRDGKLIFDTGEIASELRPLMNEAGQVVAYLFADPPLAGRPAPVVLQQGSGGSPEVVVTVEGENPEATETYVLTLVEPAATPVP